MTTYSADVNEAEFPTEVIEESKKRLVVVDFWAPWCGPCRVLKPLLEKLSEEYQGRFFLAKVNSDVNQRLAMNHGVRGIPSVKAFRDGVLVDEFSGALPEGYIRSFLERLLPSEVQLLVAAAKQALTQNDEQQALAKLNEALAIEPENSAARVEKAALLFERGELAEAVQLVAGLQGDILDFERTQRLLAQLALAQKISQLRTPEVLQQAIARGEGALQARIDLAAHYASRERYEDALTELLESLKVDRHFADGAARREMLALFDILGADDPLVQQFRRKMAAVLH